MDRIAQEKLIVWKNKPNRKPLLVYGARQVGKTWLMKNFATNHFEDFIYVNFERDIILKELFKSDLNPERIIKALEVFSNKTVSAGKMVLLFDEIQDAPGGLTALKYFNEEMPNLHIIAAGSLLGISIRQETSFPVGQVEFLNLYPLSFSEFLNATGNRNIEGILKSKDWQTTSLFKKKIIALLKQYYFVGGMPEVVSSLSQVEDYTLVREIQENILKAYEQDFAKYAPSEVIPKIRMVWNTMVSQLSKENKKFVYGVVKEGGRAKEFESALNWLEDYGIVKKVYNTSKANLPLGAYQDIKSFKLYLSDVGLLCAMAKLNEKVILEQETLFQEFKGSLTEQYVLQELSFLNDKGIYYWSNDSGNAEVDFVFESRNTIIPLEVKASENLQSKSLKVFSEKYKDIHCYRASLSNYRKETWLTNIPLYAIAHYFKP